MANHASAEKRNRQRIKRTDRNRAAKSALRTELKKARAAIKGAPEAGASAARMAASVLDSTASKGIIPKKRASRLKSRLAAALHKVTVSRAS
jgi:small subunit ribosomal protein S20